MIPEDDPRYPFYSSLGEPYYSSDASDPSEPFIMWGTLNSVRTAFFASPTDPHDYGRDLHARVAAGEFGPIRPFTQVGPYPGSKR